MANNFKINNVDFDTVFLSADDVYDSGDPMLHTWGENAYGQLGLGVITHRSSPTQMGSLTDWASVGCGSGFTVAIKTNNTLWAWGVNSYGQLGLGDITHRSSPVQVGALTNWSSVAAGIAHTAAIKTDGTLWVCGQGSQGALGLGDINNRSSPVQVGTLTDWASVSSGDRYTAAVKTDGTLWAWGNNDFGQLGLGDRTHRSSPVKVGTLTNWASVSASVYHTFGVKTDGTLWAWGMNKSGVLGLGDVVHRSSPVQVGSLTNWATVSTGNEATLNQAYTAAIKTDGTLWTLGDNGSGQLGLGDSTTRSSPVQVGTLTNWASVSVSPTAEHMISIKTDGTLWVWGSNGFGQLGLGDLTSRSSPVQVGALTNWISAAAGNRFVATVKYFSY